MSAASQPLIEVEHLSMRFGGLVAVDDVSFSAGPRAITVTRVFHPLPRRPKRRDQL